MPVPVGEPRLSIGVPKWDDSYNFVLRVPYLVVAAAIVSTLVFAPSTQVRWLSLAVLAVFTLLLTFALFRPITAREVTLYLAAQTSLLVVLYLLYPGSLTAPLLTFVTCVQAVLFVSRRQAAGWIGLWIALTAMSLIWVHGIVTGLAQSILYIAGYCFFVAFAQATRVAERAHKEAQRLLDELQSAHRQLQTYTDQIEALTAAEERNRIGRELHDTLGHRLTVSAVQLEVAQRLIVSDPPRAQTIVGTTRDEVRAALADLRGAVAALRQPLDENTGQALTKLVKNFQRATATPVSLTLPGQIPTLPDNYQTVLYRGVQEALTNIQKHAEASQVWVALSMTKAEVLLSIEDNGKGFMTSQQPNGYGLCGLQERVATLNGTLAIESHPGAGARLTLCLPQLILGETDHDGTAACVDC